MCVCCECVCVCVVCVCVVCDLCGMCVYGVHASAFLWETCQRMTRALWCLTGGSRTMAQRSTPTARCPAAGAIVLRGSHDDDEYHMMVMSMVMSMVMMMMMMMMMMSMNDHDDHGDAHDDAHIMWPWP